MTRTFRLDVDADRDGAIEEDEPGRWDWGWGAGRPGAIALVDLDPDGDDARDMAEVRLVVGETADDAEVVISLDALSAGSVSVWAEGAPSPFAGRVGDSIVERAAIPAASAALRVQVREFPDAGWDGLIELIAVLFEGEDHVGLDRILVRASPWIMPSTLQPPEEAYVISLGGENEDFLTGLRAACREAAVPLREIDVDEARGDRWIQDEIEFGYAQAPSGTVHVILDGARDRELDGVARRRLAADGVGVWELHSHLGLSSSLDSFGNLEVSPPVVANGVDYRLGRIILGTKKALGVDGEKSSLALRRFLHSQRVQAPLEVHTDWLVVGHVDEIISIVPSDGDRGWRVLVASPKRFRSLLTELADDGHADALFFEGKRRRSGDEAQRTTKQLLAGDAELDWDFNEGCIDHLDRVKGQLKVGLGLADEDFVEVPVGFMRHSGQFAVAYFPDMVNHLILGDVSVVPDPYGPDLDGDPLKEAFLEAVGSRRKGVHFVDDWMSYHEALGEVHCGTNVRRTPDTSVKWWETSLPGLWDASVRSRL